MGDNSIERLEAREPEADETPDLEPAEAGAPGEGGVAPAAIRAIPAPGGGKALALSALVLAVLAGAGGGWLYWQQQGLRAELGQASERAQQLESYLARAEAALREAREDADRAREALNARLDQADAARAGLEASVGALDARLREQLARQPESWRAAEAEYLVRLAARRLAERDSATALRLLADADARVGDLEAAMGLRAALAQDMATLRTSPRVDLPGLNLRIEALLPRIAALPEPLPAAEPEAPADAEARVEAELRSDWRKAWDQVWQALKRDWIEVRHYQGANPELELPEVRQYLDQNLALALQQAQWAANRADATGFQGALGRAETWVGRYFRAEAPETQGFLAALAELKAVDVAPALPGVEASLKAAGELAVGLSAAAERVADPAGAAPDQAGPEDEAPAAAGGEPRS